LAFPLRLGLPRGLFASRIRHLAKIIVCFPCIVSIAASRGAERSLTTCQSTWDFCGREISLGGQVSVVVHRSSPVSNHSTTATTCSYRKANTWSTLQKQCFATMSESSG
jgi:hypothetical protein